MWPQRKAGSGQVTTVSFAVPAGSLGHWAGRLRGLGVPAAHEQAFDSEVIAVHDPDGIRIELVADATDEGWVPWREGPVSTEHAIRGFHSVTLTVAEAAATLEFLAKTMGFREMAHEGSRTRFETGAGGPDATVDIIESAEGPVGEETIGTVHHVAWRATDDRHQQEWRDVLVSAGRNVTPVIDRYYFKSIYYREPGGVLFEIATDSPGFTVDEAPEALGASLSLPPWYQGRRETLNTNLTPLVIPSTAPSGASSRALSDHTS
jgi:glyoxalase family protein